MSFISQIKEEHTKILGVLNEIEKIGVSDVDSVFKLLKTSAEYIISHLEKENTILYPTLLQAEDSKTVNIANDFKLDMKILSMDIMNFFDDYKHTTCIENNTTAYLEDLSRIIINLKTRIEKEEKTLYPLFIEDDNINDN
jgi:hemerythrin-like domain-containing protein